MLAGAVGDCGKAGPLSESLSALSLSLLRLESGLPLSGFITCSINSSRLGCNFISSGSESILTENNREPFLLGGAGGGDNLKFTFFLPILLSHEVGRSSDATVE